MKRQAFTLIEIVITLVIMGILTLMATSPWSEAIESTHAVRIQSLISSLRNALALDRQRLISSGENPFRLTLDDALTQTVGVPIFDGNLSYPLLEGVKQSQETGGCMKKKSVEYECKVNTNMTVTLTYDPATGKVICNGEGCTLVE